MIGEAFLILLLIVVGAGALAVIIGAGGVGRLAKAKGDLELERIKEVQDEVKHVRAKKSYQRQLEMDALLSAKALPEKTGEEEKEVVEEDPKVNVPGRWDVQQPTETRAQFDRRIHDQYKAVDADFASPEEASGRPFMTAEELQGLKDYDR